MLGFRLMIARSVMAVLAPLTGTRSSGTVTVKATGSDVKFPGGCFAAPIIESESGNKAIARDKPVFVGMNPSTAEGDWTVTAAGTALPVTSLLGGARHNFEAASTTLRWDPAMTGVELVSALAGDMTGGLDPTGDAHVKRILLYEDLSTAEIALQVFQAKMLTQAPAVILAWAGTGAGERMGRSVWQRPDRWVAYVVVTRQSGTVERGHEGLNLLDLVESYLGERGAVDGRNFSDPPVTIVGASRHSTTPSSFVYALTFETTSALQRTDTRLAEGKFGPWDRTNYDVTVATAVPFPLVVDAEYDQP
jgi:hypothetical protein